MPIKSDIVHILNKRFPQLMMDDINLSVNVILNEIGNALQQGRKAEFREFGVFTAKKKSARTARNPKTGALLITPEKITPHFKPSIFLNRRLNNPEQELKFSIKQTNHADEHAGVSI
jgi:integration host factor subunit beta